jgi:hypothetical protein
MPDVFISYAHEDNESPPYPFKGWVERFYDALKARDIDTWLKQRRFTVWKRTGDENDQLSIELHKERLELSNGVLIYYGEARESWLQPMLLRLGKDFALKEIGRKPSCIAFRPVRT